MGDEVIRIGLENVGDYLESSDALSNTGVCTFRALTGGVSSVIIEIEDSGGERVVLKQPLSEVRNLNNEILGVFPLSRNLREQDCIDWMNTFLPEGVVPRILYRDRSNFLFIMTAMPRDAQRWQDLLLEGKCIDPLLAREIGAILAAIQNSTAEPSAASALLKDNSCFLWGRMEPFYEPVQRERPQLTNIVKSLIKQSVSTHECLCTADFNPKNTLVVGREFALVDHEVAHIGDAAFDVAIFLAHLLLKAIHMCHRAHEYARLAEELWAGYSDALDVWSANGRFEDRVACHTAMVMLARVFGRLPVTYLSLQEKQRVTVIAERALLSHVDTISCLLEEATASHGAAKVGRTR